MSKITQHINHANLIRINQSLRGFPKVDPTTVFDEDYQRPISECLKLQKRALWLRDLVSLWKIRINLN